MEISQSERQRTEAPACAPFDPLERRVYAALAGATAARHAIDRWLGREVRRALVLDLDGSLQALGISDAGRKRVTRGWHRRSLRELFALAESAREMVAEGHRVVSDVGKVAA